MQLHSNAVAELAAQMESTGLEIKGKEAHLQERPESKSYQLHEQASSIKVMIENHRSQEEFMGDDELGRTARGDLDLGGHESQLTIDRLADETNKTINDDTMFDDESPLKVTKPKLNN